MSDSVEALLDGDGRLRFLQPVDARRTGRVRLTFLENETAEDEGAAEKAPPKGKGEGHIRARTSAGGLRTAVEAGGFPLTSDEPPDVEGGTGTGPTPYDLLGAALAACTTMTLRLYADRKGWPLEAATARVEHEKVHAIDCAHCETEEGKVDRFTRTLHLAGPLTREQRQRLVEIAARCPVHRTLESEVDIVTVEEREHGDG